MIKIQEAPFIPYFMLVKKKEKGPTIKFVVSHPANQSALSY